MVNWNICNSAVPAQKISTLPVNVHDWEKLVIFERIEAPSLLRNPSFGRLAVLNHNTSESVGIL